MERYKSIKVSFWFLAFFGIAFHGYSSTISVKKYTALSAIQAAISQAHPYDSVLVYEGTYAEKEITVDKPLYLIGIHHPVLDGEKQYQIISVKASNVVIDGFTLRNSGRSSMNDIAGIKTYYSSNVTIRNNELHNMFFAIYFQGCNNCTAAENLIETTGSTEVQSGNGIHCWKCDIMHIAGNTIFGQRDGIYFEFVTNSVIERNLSKGNIRYGLHFMFSHSNTYESNTFQHNGAGVAVMYTHKVKMYNNKFIDNWGGAAYGILMKDISDSHVEGNLFAGNTMGIYMEGSSRIDITKNNFNNNGCAIRIQASCDDNVVEKNNFRTNTFDVNTNGTLVLNSFRNNYWDKYDGYDLNHDGIGDRPYSPVSMYSMIIDRIPVAAILLRSFMVSLLDRAEKAIPSLTPENFKDTAPSMKPVSF